MTVHELQCVITPVTEGAHYVLIGDGHSGPTEFCWMPANERWVYCDGNNYTSGSAQTLTFIFSAEDGDRSGLNCGKGIVACDLEGPRRGLWVYAGELPAGYELPADAEVYTVADPVYGLTVWNPPAESAR